MSVGKKHCLLQFMLPAIWLLAAGAACKTLPVSGQENIAPAGVSSLLERDLANLSQRTQVVASERNLPLFKTRAQDDLLASRAALFESLPAIAVLLQAIVIGAILFTCRKQLRLNDYNLGDRDALDLALDASDDAFWTWDMRRGYLRVSPKIKNQLDLDGNRDWERFKSYLQLVHPDDKAAALQHLKAYLRSQTGVCRLDIRFRAKGDSYLWIRVWGKAQWGLDGRPIRMAGFLANVTELKSIAEQLHQEKTQLLNILDATGAGTWEWSCDGDVFIVNAQWYKHIGFSSNGYSMISLQEWRDCVHPADLPVVDKAISDYFSGESTRYMCEYRRRHKDGHWVWIADRGQVIEWTPEGVPLRMCGAHIDISARKTVDSVISETRQLKRGILEAAPIGIGVIHSGVFEEVNQQFCDLLECAVDDIVGNTILPWCPDQAVAKTLGTHLEACMNDPHRVPVEVKLRRQGGDLVDVLVSGAPLKLRTGELGLVITLTDVTSTKESFRRLERVEAHLSTFYDLGLIGVAVISPDRRWIQVNDRLCEMLGYTSDELLSLTWQDVTHMEDVDKSALNFESVLNKERDSYTIDKRYMRKDGTPIDVLVHVTGHRGPTGEADHFQVFILDVSEAKQNVSERDMLASIVEQAGDSIVVTDSNFKIQYVNAAFCRTSGLSKKEVVGEHAFSLKSSPQDDEYYRSMCATLRRKNRWEGRHVTHRPDGTTYIEDASIEPFRNESGKITGYVGVRRDVSNSVRLELERDRLQQQFIQAQKLESVGRLAGGVAHDFNNMLGLIIGYSELAASTLGPDHAATEYLQEIQDAGRRSADLTRQLLAFARKQSSVPRVLDLNETVEGMLKMLRRLVGENVELHWQPDTAIGLVRMDPAQIDQILANLMVNARDAIEDVGCVVIETLNVTLGGDAGYVEGEFTPGQYVRLSVSDSGCGMTEEVKMRLFEPFFTTKEKGKGTGLGLATVYGIVRQNKGLIHVYSEPGKGTTFHIYLPRAEQQEKVEPRPVANSPDLRGTETIVVVEDEAGLLKFAQRLLEGLGYTVIVATTPREAVKLIESKGDEVNLLLTDVIMPDMSGRDLWEAVRPNHPKLKCLYMSGYTADIIAHHGVLNNDAQFIQKPFAGEALARKVREVLDTAGPA